ncbi:MULTISPECIES: LacI family DNA-binding transcriptional regulator [Microbacterium]|uniref:LacI family transcriptional regulator n=1 Tax=Microbacterium sufflavum TaxID=2851649 RepID=A0ABY4IEJ8_9MICO|nr:MULTISPECIES: LacI family DNA-binding transcriptional regulator [Microbacterium]MBN6191765.1 LacI family DNA-binding transcriptional regulator [Aneurinibacillus sp. BA2021]MCK2025407.1 LacI family transcriptional regulator [Microbacterium sufflavum]UPL10286.1 LacI family transcriptional regulator [Microbacterium sufflavum]
MASGKRVTIADIARLAGVSPGAVSFALNGRPGVSEETRQRILAIIEEHHWQPSSAARALVGARANAVGFALARPARSLGSEAFFTDLIAGIESRLSESKVSLQLRLVADIDEEMEVHRQWRSSNQVDGIIYIDPRDDDPRAANIASLDARAVMIGSEPSAEGDVPSVWIGDEEVAETLFSYLAALGHTRIAYVAGPAELEHTRLRAEVLERLAADGIAGEVIATDFSPARASAVTRTLLSGKQRPTAIVYDNDVMAVAGLRVAQEMGRTVPRDVSLASFDDSVIAGLINPSITAMTRDTFELGEQAATLLLQQIEAGATLPSVAGPTPTLTARESTAPPAS